MAYVPNSGSVVVFQNNPSVLQALVTVTNPVTISSVSGQVGASIIGLTPVSVSNFPTNPSISGQVGASIIGLPPINGNVASGVLDVGNPVKVGGKFNSSVVTLLDLQRGDIQLDSLGNVKVIPQGNASISGTVLVGNFPTTQNISGSVVAFGTIGASIIGLTPVSIPGNVTVVSSIAGGIFPISGSVAATVTNTVTVVSSIAGGLFPISGSVAATIVGTPNVNTAGSVVAFQGTSPWVIQSIVGTYAEDAASADSDKGLFILGVRNDTVSSLTSASEDYAAMAVDAVGRTIIKPFAGENATIISYVGSVVSGSVTLIQASAIGSRSYITDFYAANTGSVSTLITFQGGDTSIVGFTIAPAGGGSNAPGMAIPWKTTLSQDLAFKSGTSTSILYLTVKGYQAQ